MTKTPTEAEAEAELQRKYEELQRDQARNLVEAEAEAEGARPGLAGVYSSPHRFEQCEATGCAACGQPEGASVHVLDEE